MPRRPETQYVWNGDAALAYQVFGDGAVDLVYLQGYTSHVDLNWDSPHLARFLQSLGQLARVTHIDRRGWGCSERFSPGDVAPLEVQVDDLRTVMDAAGSERAVLFVSVDTGPTGVLFAASYPERTAGLVLCDTFLYFSGNEDDRRRWAEMNDRIRRGWGRPGWERGWENAYPWDEREYADWFVPWCRASVAPGALAAEAEAFAAVDVRGVLTSIQAPTLLVGRGAGDRWLDTTRMVGRAEDPVEEWKFELDRIRDARLILPSQDGGAGPFHWYGRAPAVLEGVRELTRGIDEEQRILDRVLATVLFTDIVGSAELAAQLGDVGWGELVERHHAIVRGLLARYRGVEVDTAGDGFFTTFDGPARAARCATAIVEAVRPLGIEVRAGVHTGEVETIDGKAGGLAVVMAARIAAAAGASEVLASRTVKDLTVGSGLTFVDAGEHGLKGVPDRWRLYRVGSG